jgi:hypothetical protein
MGIQEAIRRWVKTFVEFVSQYSAALGIDSDAAWALQGEGCRTRAVPWAEPELLRDPALADTSAIE